MRKLNAVLIAVMVTTLLLSGCGEGGTEATSTPMPPTATKPSSESVTPTPPPAEPAAAEGGSVTLGLQGDPERMISTIWPMASAITIHDLLYSRLMKANPEMKFVPDAAERVEYSEDGRTMTFYLRKDVSFHDGEPLTAHDVAFTYSMIGDPEYNGGQDAFVSWLEGIEDAREGVTEGISGIKVLDDYTISFTSKEPFAPGIVYMGMEIMPEHILGDVPVKELNVHDFNFHPVGSGPFKMVEYVPDRHVILEANPDYFEGRPTIDRIVFRIASYEALVNSWLKQEIDAVPVAINELESVEKADFGFAYEFNSERPTYIGLNCKSVYFNDARVRRAVSLALDREMIVDVILDGRGVPISQVHPPHMWGYTDEIPVPEQDYEAAGALLDEAGWTLNSSTGIREKDGVPFEVELAYVTDREAYQPDLAALVQTQLNPLGLNVSLRAFDSPSLWPLVLPRDGNIDPEAYDFVLASISISNGDPDWLQTYLGSWSMPPLGINYYYFENEEVDKVLKEQATIMDFEERRAYFADVVWPAINQEAPIIPVLAPLTYFAVNNEFEGFMPASNGWSNNVLSWTVQK